MKRLISQSMCALIAALLLAPLAATLGAQTPPTGRVTGRVIDATNAQPLPGVPVEVVGSSIVTHTDLDGRWMLTLPPGSHRIKVVLEGYAERLVAVDVAAGQVRDVNVTLSLGGFTESVTVSGQATEAETASAAAQLVERRRASAITDNLGGQEMKLNADANAASALQRVTGLSVVDNQYVFVRGLGERYSNTTLNGAMLPSTEPERKVVSLDMFPAGLLDNVSVVKSYTPDRPAEFAGGLVEIVPSKLPSRPRFDLGYSFGANSRTFGKDVLDHPGGNNDWLGIGDSSRQLSPLFPTGKRVIRGGIFSPELGVSRVELEQLGETFANIWEPRAAKGRANQGWSAAYANRFGNLGVLASVSHSYRNERQLETQNYFRIDENGGLSPFSEYEYDAAATKATLAGVLNLAYQLTPNNRLSVQGFSTDKGRRETRTFEGFNADAGRVLRNARLLWQEENLRSAQVTGEHFVSTWSNSRLEWRGTVSRSNLDQPDMRETLYEQTGSRFLLADESQSGLRMFNDLDENAVDLGASWSIFFTNWRGLPTMVKAGPGYTRRERDFSSRRFRFIPLANTTERFDFSQAPEQIFTAANIGPYFELREETRATDFYTAEQTVASMFGMVDLPLTSAVRLIGGVRVERFEQIVDTFDLFDIDADGESATIRGEIAETDLFPSLNLVYAVRGNHNLRAGFSQTVNRPEFREVAPFEFTDIVGGRSVVGNADLTRSLIQNYDLRWEWFPGAEEVVSASVFFKNFDQPIERFVEPTAQLRTSYTNAASARNFGIELEARKRVTDFFLAGANYTFVDSEIELTPAQNNVLTSLVRPLSGTSRHLFNGLAEIRAGGTVGRVLVNYFGDRIADVGSLGLPDILEKGRATIDVALSQRIGRLNLRLSADNLTDEPVSFLQSAETQREYRIGRTLQITFGFSAF